jgi:hypothetical protein
MVLRPLIMRQITKLKVMRRKQDEKGNEKMGEIVKENKVTEKKERERKEGR